MRTSQAATTGANQIESQLHAPSHTDVPPNYSYTTPSVLQTLSTSLEVNQTPANGLNTMSGTSRTERELNPETCAGATGRTNTEEIMEERWSDQC